MKYIGLNHTAVEAKDAVVSALDHGFLYGMGLFETFRTYGGVPFLLQQHLERLADGCRQLGIPFEADEASLSKWITQVMEANGLEEAYIRYTVTAGEDILGLPAGEYRQPNHLLYIKELPKLDPALYLEGKGLQLLNTPRNTPEGPVRLKSLHYMNNILAKRELAGYPSAAGGAEGLMLTGQGYIAEGIVSNIFYIKDDVLYTPDIKAGILPGITREMVLRLAPEAGLQAEQGFYRWEQLLAADEIFLTNSIQEIVPVTMLWQGNEPFQAGKGFCGRHTAGLIRLYRERTEALR
ncbi:4-amino-4-deoxychorismate lyase [Paenibacillus sp. FSL R7-0273]|uniref:aminotransferase class IV n=1 Tax=Paenibacillus sp. FSL R7-0273 TaxID=1536772 RepID=UPI0004F5DBB9|nr:aminotransferase class IV [Paenibacillus sp. FSL R7-0273]AIQ44540.1 4-amino-4-deoxychorismate lyase [Paenibacillus sp. FSL R7-0273]OMF85428.1 4-amino-4-deoxychorismate lyase [Paenibacillus sp. FSL R7-0273]